MLSERITQLISAYVDGELSARERRAVSRLLRKSPEARLLLHQMKQDSMILRKLPRRKTQLDLSGSVMGTISLRNIQLPKIESTVAAQTLVAAEKRRPLWLKLTAAVVLLSVVGLGSYFIFSAALNPNTARSTGPDPTHSDNPQTPGGPSADDRPPPVITMLHEPERSPVVPDKEARKDDRFGQGHIKPPPFVASQPRLMAILNLRDVDQPPTALHVTQELKRDNASRLDLFCLTDTRKALERLQTVLKARNITLRIDTFAQTRLKQTPKTNFALYTEELTPDELTALLAQLAAEDQKLGTPAFDKLTINPLTPEELAKVLGGEPSFYQQPAARGPLGVDVSKDISSGTGSQIVQNLGGHPAVQAVLVPYGLPQPGFSQEVKNLVESRKGWKAGAVQVLLVLWNAN